MGNRDAELLEQFRNCTAGCLLGPKADDAFSERQQSPEARSLRRFKRLYLGIEQLDEVFTFGDHEPVEEHGRYSVATEQYGRVDTPGARLRQGRIRL